MIAPLVAAKSSPESPSMPVSAWSQPMVTIEPEPWAFIRRPTSRQRRIVATTSTDQSRSSLASNESLAAAPVKVSAPAICSQASSPPQRAQASSTSRSPAARSARSAMSTAARPPRSRISAATSSAAPREVRPWTITLAPAPASARATARPIPDVEPSTAVRYPSRSPSDRLPDIAAKTLDRSGWLSISMVA